MKDKIQTFCKNHTMCVMELIVLLHCCIICLFVPKLWDNLKLVMIVMFTPLTILDLLVNFYFNRKEKKNESIN